MMIGRRGRRCGPGDDLEAFWSLRRTSWSASLRRFVQQFRFAAADVASEAFRPRAISLVLAGGIAAGVIGPQTAIHMNDALAPVPWPAPMRGCRAERHRRADPAVSSTSRGRQPARPASGRSLGEIVRRPDFSSPSAARPPPTR
jgi:hypothetical protein